MPDAQPITEIPPGDRAPGGVDPGSAVFDTRAPVRPDRRPVERRPVERGPAERRPVERQPDERQARRELRTQIARLERELAETFVSAFPRTGVEVSVPSSGGPRLLGLGELEAMRDALAGRLGRARRQLTEHAEREERNRVLLERMLLEPGRYKFVRIPCSELGERGCGEWHVRPRFGLIGMLAGWWQVKLSSGCPLAEGPPGSGRPASNGMRPRRIDSLGRARA
ncbi:MAG TPA: hypothetical protein VGY97_01035 [Solirubrobacteraceae bacterium]|nr:hypothetical protein [Solirubrobacteraceae bacterium]